VFQKGSVMNEFDYSDKTALIQELESNLWEYWSHFGRGPGCTLHDEENTLWFETPIPILPYSGRRVIEKGKPEE
jgi:hypothetical protein